MASVQTEDVRDLELQDELQQAYQHYLQAGDVERPEARATYLAQLRTFTTRVLGRPSNG
jgi:hypothetical protein